MKIKRIITEYLNTNISHILSSIFYRTMFKNSNSNTFILNFIYLFKDKSVYFKILI